MIVVADASPLIALARIGRLELLHEVFGTLYLPDAVWREVVEAGMARIGAEAVMHADWIERRSVADGTLVTLLRRDLGAGEAEAIVLARETGAALLLIDERMGRAAARRLGLRVTGLVGVLIEARERGFWPMRTPWSRRCIKVRASGCRRNSGGWSAAREDPRRVVKSSVPSPVRFIVTKKSFADYRVTKLELGHKGSCLFLAAASNSENQSPVRIGHRGLRGDLRLNPGCAAWRAGGGFRGRARLK